MSFYWQRFNLYFLAAALVVVATGCSSTLFHHKKEQIGILRVHIESESSAQGLTKSITVLRSQPVLVNVTTDPVLTEADVLSARLLDSPGGFAVEIKLDETSGWRLEQYSAANPGKHLAIFAQWSEKQADGRWLAAPIIVRRMAGSSLLFTPDASHEEMQKWVDGLNATAKKNAAAKGSQ
jgi:hypothetical protein